MRHHFLKPAHLLNGARWLRRDFFAVYRAT